MLVLVITPPLLPITTTYFRLWDFGTWHGRIRNIWENINIQFFYSFLLFNLSRHTTRIEMKPNFRFSTLSGFSLKIHSCKLCDYFTDKTCYKLYCKLCNLTHKLRHISPPATPYLQITILISVWHVVKQCTNCFNYEAWLSGRLPWDEDVNRFSQSSIHIESRTSIHRTNRCIETS